MINILLVDDDAGLRRVIQFKLKQRNFEVTVAENGLQALDEIQKTHFDLVLTDMKMPEMNGIELLEHIKQIKPNLEVILITAHADISHAVKAMKLGAFDYLPKPFDDDQLFITIEKALKFKNLENENIRLKKRLAKKEKPFHIIGVSDAYKKILALTKQVAPSDANILITGASGTGKEVIARLIHEQSNRSDAEMVTINCAAIPKELLEAELYGHVKGAFTGAVKDKKGKFELAEKSTLFLDEIGEMPIDLQAKLLRVIQERVIEPLGSEKKVNIDIRLIAATNANLEKLVIEGAFRKDLFYRLNVIPIELPLLHERKDDIPVLIQGFLKKFAPDKNMQADDRLVKKLTEYSWPGNIRELENLIERMVILSRKEILTEKDLPDRFLSGRTTLMNQENASINLSIPDNEIRLISKALEISRQNKTKAAELLQIPRHVLIYRIKKYKL